MWNFLRKRRSGLQNLSKKWIVLSN
jgi:hypothetical protein